MNPLQFYIGLAGLVVCSWAPIIALWVVLT